MKISLRQTLRAVALAAVACWLPAVSLAAPPRSVLTSQSVVRSLSDRGPSGSFARITSAPEEAPPAPLGDRVYIDPTNPFPADCDCDIPSVCTSGCGNRWVRAEYLLWFGRGRSLPPLVTTGPASAGQAVVGTLGRSDTDILFGNERVSSERSGGRLSFGYWLDDCASTGVGARLFATGPESASFRADSNGDPVLARPFFDPFQGIQDTLLVAFPGVVQGRIDVLSTNKLLGAEVFFRTLLRQDCDMRVDLIGGYQFTRIDDDLRVDTSSVFVQSGGTPPQGTVFNVMDIFDARNEFHGGELGLMGTMDRGPWSLQVMGKIALGTMHEMVTVRGQTVVTVPNSAPTTTQSGLFAQASNSGVFERNEFAVMPEAAATLVYSVNCRMDVSVGYSFMYWSKTALAADQVNLNINPAQPQGPDVPVFAFRDSSYWVQGINFGLQVRF